MVHHISLKKKNQGPLYDFTKKPSQQGKLFEKHWKPLFGDDDFA